MYQMVSQQMVSLLMVIFLPDSAHSSVVTSRNMAFVAFRLLIVVHGNRCE